MPTLSLTLPVAPTANNAFYNRRGVRGGYGRIKTEKYRSWLRQADAWYQLQHLGRVEPITGAYACAMTFPAMTRGDLDGRQKLILDWLVSRNLVEDDGPKYLRELYTKMSDEPGELVWIVLRGEAVK